MSEVSFAKMHGQGNDFVVLDGIATPDLQLDSKLARALADRYYGVGADQILVVSATASDGVFNYRIFNADGGEVAQCGNGARSVWEFLQRRDYYTGPIELRTLVGNIKVRSGKNGPRADLAVPLFAPRDIPCKFDPEQPWYEYVHRGKKLKLATVNLGNPHAIMWTKDSAGFELRSLGVELNNRKIFSEGVNVSVATRGDNDNVFKLRTYERGVGETQACGSAACACAVIARRELSRASVAVSMTGGDLLAGWDGANGAAWIEGEVTTVFDGKLNLDDFGNIAW